VSADDDVADARVIGQHGGDGRRPSLSPMVGIAEMGDGADTRRAAVEGLGDGAVEGVRAVAVEEPVEAVGVMPERLAPTRHLLEDSSPAAGHGR